MTLNDTSRSNTWTSEVEQVDQKHEKDHFRQSNGIEYAGDHILVDLWSAKHLDDISLIEQVLRKCVDACNATLLHIHLHHFTSSGGVSGVALLAESHLSVHTWPERNYAAFDIFMCGDSEPENAIKLLKNAFDTNDLVVTEFLRGRTGR